MRLDGLMSRCTTPHASAAANARAACSITSKARGERHWPIAAYTGFQRFSLDQFHDIETLALLLSIVSHPGNIWMMNVRSRARFAQKTRPRAGILRHPTVDDLEGNSRVQNCIASAISYGHSPRTELDRKTIRTYLHFEVGVSQWSGRQSTPRRWSLHVLAVRQKAKGNETTQALSFWTALSERSSTCGAGPRSWRLRFGWCETNAFVVHV